MAYRAFTLEHLEVTAPPPVGTPLLIVCFPLGFHDTLHHLPVVRQAVIASSYGLRFQGKGYFLTDARTHRGTSGAPVLMSRAAPPEGSDLAWTVLGIHSARIDIGTRDLILDEALGLNCAWYADILLPLPKHDIDQPGRHSAEATTLACVGLRPIADVASAQAAFTHGTDCQMPCGPRRKSPRESCAKNSLIRVASLRPPATTPTISGIPDAHLQLQRRPRGAARSRCCARAAAEMLDWHGSGMSVMEMSHRGKEFIGIADKAEADLRTLLAIPRQLQGAVPAGRRDRRERDRADEPARRQERRLRQHRRVVEEVDQGGEEVRAGERRGLVGGPGLHLRAAARPLEAVRPARRTCTSAPTRRSAASSTSGRRTPARAAGRRHVVAPAVAAGRRREVRRDLRRRAEEHRPGRADRRSSCATTCSIARCRSRRRRSTGRSRPRPTRC